MELSSIRATRSLTNAQLPCVSSCHLTVSDQVFLEVQFLHSALQSRGLSQGRKLNDWAMTWFRNLQRNGVPYDMIKPAHRDIGFLDYHTLEVFAFLALVASHLSENQIAPMVKRAAVSYLQVICALCVAVVAVETQIDVGTLSLTIAPNHLIGGWGALMTHIDRNNILSQLWQTWLTEGKFGLHLASSWETPTFVDAFIFTTLAATTLQSRSPVLNSIKIVFGALLLTTADLFRTYLRTHLLVGGPADSDLPPVLRQPEARARPKRLDPRTAWSLLQKSKELKLPIGDVIKSNRDRPEFLGLSPQQGFMWAAFLLSVLLKKVKTAFASCRQLGISFDPSTYNGEETGVGVAYSWRTGLAAYTNVSIIPASKWPSVLKIDFIPDLEHIAVTRKLERWAAYKELRALNASVKHLNGMTLDDFKLPPGFTVRAVKPGERRVVTTGNVGFIVKVGIDEGGRPAILERTQEMPSELPREVPFRRVHRSGQYRDGLDVDGTWY